MHGDYRDKYTFKHNFEINFCAFVLLEFPFFDMRIDNKCYLLDCTTPPSSSVLC